MAHTLIASAVSTASYGTELATLAETTLYSEVARSCQFVDLATWNHPTKTVLVTSHVKLISLELCNSRTLPIFHVEFAFDPMGLTDSFFGPFYNAMVTANGNNSMAFVDVTDSAIVLLRHSPGKTVVTYESYRQSGRQVQKFAGSTKTPAEAAPTSENGAGHQASHLPDSGRNTGSSSSYQQVGKVDEGGTPYSDGAWQSGAVGASASGECDTSRPMMFIRGTKYITCLHGLQCIQLELQPETQQLVASQDGSFWETTNGNGKPLWRERLETLSRHSVIRITKVEIVDEPVARSMFGSLQVATETLGGRVGTTLYRCKNVSDASLPNF